MTEHHQRCFQASSEHDLDRKSAQELYVTDFLSCKFSVSLPRRQRSMIRVCGDLHSEEIMSQFPQSVNQGQQFLFLGWCNGSKEKGITISILPVLMCESVTPMSKPEESLSTWGGSFSSKSLTTGFLFRKPPSNSKAYSREAALPKVLMNCEWWFTKQRKLWRERNLSVRAIASWRQLCQESAWHNLFSRCVPRIGLISERSHTCSTCHGDHGHGGLSLLGE